MRHEIIVDDFKGLREHVASSEILGLECGEKIEFRFDTTEQRFEFLFEFSVQIFMVISHWRPLEVDVRVRQGEFVGAISMMPKIGFATNTGEIGYWLGVPYWNHGYMSESTRAVIDWGFNSLKLHRIFAEALTRNPASARVMAKAGMLFEGTARGKLIKHGKYEDMVNYAILETDRQA